MIVRLKLNHGKSTVVDAEDAPILRRYAWRAVRRHSLWYAAGVKYGPKGRRDVYLHRLIAHARRGQTIDHLDGDGLNNRRRNLRKCSTKENIRNARIKPHSSRFKGVYWSRHNREWRAQIGVNRRIITLGGFASETAAARAYNAAAVKHHGRFARLNEVR